MVRKRLATLAPGIFVGVFIVVWVVSELLTASKHPVPGWDGMVYWINGQSYLQGRPLYEYSRPPVLSLFLAIPQALGMPLAQAFVLQPIVTGFSAMILFMLLRAHVRDWLAATGSVIFLSTSIVEFWSSTLLAHGFATAFVLAGLYCLDRHSFKRLMLGASCLSLAVFTNFLLVLVVLPMLLLYALRHRRLIDIDAVTVGGILPLVPYLLSFPTGIFDIARQITMAVMNQNSLVRTGFSKSVSPLLYFDWLASNLVFLVPLLAIGVYAVFRGRRAWMLALWFVAYVAGFTLFSDREQRLVFELAPALAALVVIGGEHVLKNLGPGHKRQLVTGLLLLLVAGYAVNQALFVLPRVQASSGIGVPPSELESLQIIGRHIQNHTGLGDIVVAEHQVPWLSYYSSRYVYLAQLTNIHDPTVLKNYLGTFHPHPVLLVAAPALGDDIGFLGSVDYTTLIESFDAPAWGQVYLYKVMIA